MGSSCNCQRCLISTVVLLTLVVASLVAILVWRETREDEDSIKREKGITEELINSTYPMYFRTAEQQQFYSQQYMKGFENPVLIRPTIPSTEVCSFTCNISLDTPLKRRKRVVQLDNQVYHGCCVSSVSFQSPTQKTNVVGDSKTFLKLENYKQYFPEHDCQSVTGCTGCVCAQESSLHTAVVLKSGVTKAEDIDDTEIDFFFFPGCCKCINN